MSNATYAVFRSGVLGFAGTFYVKMAVNVVLRVLPTVPRLVSLDKRAWSKFFPKLFEDCMPIGLAFGVIVAAMQGVLKTLRRLDLGSFEEYRGAIGSIFGIANILFDTTIVD